MNGFLYQGTIQLTVTAVDFNPKTSNALIIKGSQNPSWAAYAFQTQRNGDETSSEAIFQ